MNKRMLLAPLVAVAIVTPALAGDWSAPSINWKDVSADLKDLRSDIKDLRNDRALLSEAIKTGAPADVRSDLRADIAKDKLDIHNDIKDLKHDFSKGRH